MSKRRLHVEVRGHPAPRLEGDAADLHDTVGGEHRRAAGCAAAVRSRRYDVTQVTAIRVSAEGQPEGDRLAPGDGPVPGAAVDGEHHQVREPGAGPARTPVAWQRRSARRDRGPRRRRRVSAPRRSSGRARAVPSRPVAAVPATRVTRRRVVRVEALARVLRCGGPGPGRRRPADARPRWRAGRHRPSARPPPCTTGDASPGRDGRKSRRHVGRDRAGRRCGQVAPMRVPSCPVLGRSSGPHRRRSARRCRRSTASPRTCRSASDGSSERAAPGWRVVRLTRKSNIHSYGGSGEALRRGFRHGLHGEVPELSTGRTGVGAHCQWQALASLT